MSQNGQRETFVGCAEGSALFSLQLRVGAEE